MLRRNHSAYFKCFRCFMADHAASPPGKVFARFNRSSMGIGSHFGTVCLQCFHWLRALHNKEFVAQKTPVMGELPLKPPDGKFRGPHLGH